MCSMDQQEEPDPEQASNAMLALALGVLLVVVFTVAWQIASLQP